MKDSVVLTETSNKKDSLIVKRQFNREHSTIYYVHSENQDKDFVLKVFPKTSQGKNLHQREKKAINFNHPNVIQYNAVSVENGFGLLGEYAKYGNFSKIMEGGPLKSEAIVRTYFRQLIEGLEYIHLQGYVHLDLTLENLVLGSDFKLKIIDFKKSQLIANTISSNGTCYTEGAFQTKSDLTAVDIFSAAQILFTFRFGKMPFKSFDDDCKNKKSYSYFLAKNEKFWKRKSNKLFGGFKISKEFIELVNGMLNPDADERLTIQQIKNSEWYKGPVVNLNELRSAMEPRCKYLEKTGSGENSLWGLSMVLLASFFS